MGTGETRVGQRRSTRLGFQIPIKIIAAATDLKSAPKYVIAPSGCTKTVNLHGALIRTSEQLVYGAELIVLVFATDHSSTVGIGHVVYVNPNDPYTVGFELHNPGNIWGVAAPPDWNDLPIASDVNFLPPIADCRPTSLGTLERRINLITCLCREITRIDQIASADLINRLAPVHLFLLGELKTAEAEYLERTRNLTVVRPS